MHINDLLKTGVERGASDLHLKVGSYPVIRVSGLAILGGVGVKVRRPGETARDTRLRLKAERKAKKLLEKRRRNAP